MVTVEELTQWLLSHGVAIVIILIVAAFSYHLLGTITKNVSRRIQEMDGIDNSERDRRTKTIFRVIHSTGVVIIIGTALMMVLTELGVPVAPVLASVGFVGLAVGLGAQTLVKDMISGLFILIENQYTVGDVVEISGVTGTVEKMTLRATEIRDLYGTLHIIPNGEIRIVANRMRDWSRAIVDVTIPQEEDVDRAVQTLQEIGARLLQESEYRNLLHEEPAVTGVEELLDGMIRLRIMVKTGPNQQWDIQRWLRRQINLAFAENEVRLAVPRQELRLMQIEKNQ